jgi:spore germination protein YaaH
VGRLSWSAPKSAKGRLAYRVYTNGKRVAQTRNRSTRVSVKVGRRYRFSVAVVRGGRVQGARCRAARTLRVRFLPPSKPKGLKLELSGSTAKLSWNKSRPGDGTLAGYRVFNDGRTVRQLKRTRASITVSRGKASTLSVRSIDTRGRMSAAATVAVPGPGGASADAPSPPQGLRAEAVSDSGVALAWNASTASRGNRVVGYRVFRDGANLGQSAATRRDVPRLDAGRAFTFTVVSVDSRGRVSAPSRALTVSTNPPPPSTGSAHAFLLASTGASFRDFQAHYRQIGAIHPTYFDCNRQTAAAQGKDDPQITQFALLRQVEVYARFDCQSTAILHRILTEPALRGAWLTTIVDTAVRNGYTGINLDFEAGAPADRGAMSSFVAELAARLHGVGKKLAVDVSAKTVDNPDHPRSGFYDYAQLSSSADVVFVMSWGIHWSTSVPGPIADMPWVQNVVSYVNTLPNRSKFVMGAPLYGMDWANGGGPANPATALEWGNVAALAASVGAPLGYDATAHETHFSYTDAQGRPHEVWALNAGAVAERIQLFRANGYGVGFWRLGEEDQALWSHPLLAS